MPYRTMMMTLALIAMSNLASAAYDTKPDTDNKPSNLPTATRTITSVSELDTLKEDTNVVLTGVVANRTDDNTIIVKDSRGGTVDVHTQMPLTVNAGDRVRVSGRFESEALGVGKQIVSARVQKL